MKKQILLLLILASAACLGSSKQNCELSYSSGGVVLSQLKPDYSKTFVGGNLRYSIEVTNTGEAKADNIKVKCEDPSELSCPDMIFKNAPFSLEPPDVSACIEGGVKQDQVLVTAQRKTGEEPAYFKVKLSYSYSSLSWSDVVLVSETQWKIRTQQGVKPVQSAYQSAAPIKIELGVPDAPVVYDTRPGASNEFPISITLKNMLQEYAYAETGSGKKNKVDSVALNAPKDGIIQFVSGDCQEKTPSYTCTLTVDVGVTTEEDQPITRMIKARVTRPIPEEETYKITAEAKYTYVVKQASQQSVEISEGGGAA